MPRKRSSLSGSAGWDDYAAFYDWENARTMARRDLPFWKRVAAAAARDQVCAVANDNSPGQVVVSGFGSMSMLDVEPGKDAIIDNSHVVAWDSTLRYEVSITTGNSGGFLGNLINSQTSGEGLVLRFSGRGKIYVCSRNRTTFKAWMQAPGR